MAITVAPSTGPVFTAGGLASGLDTNTIIDELTQIASQPISSLQNKEAATHTQISSLGNLASLLTDLQHASDSLGTNGALGIKVSSANTSFSATASPAASAGSFQIGVTQLATAATARSQAFSAATAPVTGGTLALTVGGTPYSITIDDGEALSDVAFAINQSGAPVNAAILNDGTSSYLSLTNKTTGYPIGGTPDQAFSLTETSTGTQGQVLSATMVTPAKNALFSVDGLNFTRTTNTFNDAVPGTTITLNGPSANGPETLSLDNDATATQQNLQSFIDAYNNTIQAVQSQFAITGTTDTTAMLTHDPALRSLETALSNLVMTKVGTGSVSSLAELGVETGEDGSLSLDTSKLASALATNPSAVNTIFQQASTGLGATVDNMIQQYTDPVTGILTNDSQGLTKSISQMDDQISSLQLRVNAYHDTLVQRFSDMETIVSKMKTVASYLTAQAAKS